MHLGLGEGSRIDALVRAVLYLAGLPILFENHFNGELPKELENSSGSSSSGTAPTDSCYESLGCFKTRYPEEKGYNLSVSDLDDVIPHICLYTKLAPQSCQVVEDEMFAAHPLATSNGSIFWIAHGYIENGQRPWIKDLVNELMHYDEFANIFVIDWSEASKPPYNQAVENLEMVAAFCGNVMLILQNEYNLLISETHFIGHSLGSHLGGYLGTWLQKHHNQMLGRITGLDPAQLYFQGLPPDAKLDMSDALFVDVIHTDAKPFLNGGEMGSKSSSRPVSGLGIMEPSGHADFFPNSGHDQPGCKDGVYQAILQEEGSVINGIRRFLGCDHLRSYELFTESVRTSCPFGAFACDSWEHFIESKCITNRMNRLGLHAKKPEEFESGNNANSSVVYYSITGPRAPFCREHYKVIINLAEESKYRSTSELHLVLDDNNSNGVSSSVLNLGPIDFTGKDLVKNYTVSGFGRGNKSRITLRPSSSNPLRWLMGKMATPAEPDVIISSVTVTHLETNEDEVFCPEDKNYLSSREPNPSILFSKEKCKK